MFNLTLSVKLKINALKLIHINMCTIAFALAIVVEKITLLFK